MYHKKTREVLSSNHTVSYTNYDTGEMQALSSLVGRIAKRKIKGNILKFKYQNTKKLYGHQGCLYVNSW